MGAKVESVNNSVHAAGIAARLAEVRGDLSTYKFADAVKKAGHHTNHTSVGDYEVRTAVPALYLAAVCRAFDINPAYLLLGEPPKERQAPADAEYRLDVIREALEAKEPSELRVVRHLGDE